MLKHFLNHPHYHQHYQPPLGGCVLKPRIVICRLKSEWPAAFRRLCVETVNKIYGEAVKSQPPLGGCVLKQAQPKTRCRLGNQPPLGGCVLKPAPVRRAAGRFLQPPLGGCVLKHLHDAAKGRPVKPAAFRRLCVETEKMGRFSVGGIQPPLGGCVLKPMAKCVDRNIIKYRQPPLGGCVLKPQSRPRRRTRCASRL